MIFLIHHKAEKLIKVLKDNQPVSVVGETCTAALWELAGKFPNEKIGWCENSLWDKITSEKEWNKIFKHDLIMASYAVNNCFLPKSIGYVDQLPFININRKVRYPTWQMSSDVGGIKGKVLLEFKKVCEKVNGFDYLLNSVAKVGQHNGLFCYSEPALINAISIEKPEYGATYKELFSFVFEHYTNYWTSVLFFCLYRYEKKFLLSDYIAAFLKKKKFRVEINLSVFKPKIPDKHIKSSIDVIIPTLGRRKYLEQVLVDLEKQILPPEHVIIIEQNPNEDAQSELLELIQKKWRFNVIHKFTHKTGACNARNIALEEARGEWIFFADDDIRLHVNLLEEVMLEASRYQLSTINLNCKQEDEETVFGKVKQWGSFGAGTSFVKSSFATKCKFSKVFEFGFGEDADFGMQLRNMGCDVIYHPELQTLHLKAPIGGFRETPILPWEQEKLLPKPSPTLMAYALKHYSPEQIKGYKVSLYLKFYSRQEIKNPVKYFNNMQKRWKLSEKWALKLLKKSAWSSA